MRTESLLEKITPYEVEQLLLSFTLSNLDKIINIKVSNENFHVKRYIESIKEDLHGYDLNTKIEFLYAVDSFDISEFCFPFGVNGNPHYKEIDILADEQLAWGRFFTLKNLKVFSLNEIDTNFMLISEHFNEVYTLHKIIKNNLSGLINGWNALADLIDISGINSTSPKSNKIDVKSTSTNKYIPILLSLLLGFGEDKLKEFIAILKKLIIREADVLDVFKDNTDLADAVIEAFSEARPSDLSHKTLFAEVRRYWEKESIKINYLKEETFINRQNDNRNQDCFVVDRILQINNYFSRKDTISKLSNTRFIVKLLSSTKTTKNVFINNKNLKQYLPVVNGNPNLTLDIFLNVEMLYFDAMVNSADILDQLSYILDMRYSINSRDNLDPNVVHRKSNLAIKNLRRQLEYSNTLISALNNNESKQKITETINAGSKYIKDQNNIHSLFNNIKSILKDNLTINLEESTKLSIEESKNIKLYYTCTELTQEIFKIKDITNSDFIRPFRNTRDFVIGFNHIFPILFRSFQDSVFKDAMLALIGFIMSYADPEKKQYFNKFLVLINKINQPLNSKEDKDISFNLTNHYQFRILLYLFILIFHPFPFIKPRKSSLNEEVLDLHEIEKEVKYGIKNDIQNLEKLILLDRKNIKLKLTHKDYVYFGVFVFRYLGSINESIKLGEDYLTNNIDKDLSPRISHGLFLSYYGKLRKTSGIGFSNNIYVKCIKYVLAAKNGLILNSPFIRKSFNIQNNEKPTIDYGQILIRKNYIPVEFFSYISLSNTESFLKLLKIEYDIENVDLIENKKNQEVLSEIDLYFEAADNAMQLLDISLFDYSEFCFVRAFYFYISYLLNSNNSFLKKASNFIEKSINIESHNTFYSVNNTTDFENLKRIIDNKIKDNANIVKEQAFIKQFASRRKKKF